MYQSKLKGPTNLETESGPEPIINLCHCFFGYQNHAIKLLIHDNMKRYDWKRFGKLLRLYRPDLWDAADQQNPAGLRVSPYQLQPDGVFILEPDPKEFPACLTFAEIATLWPPDVNPTEPILSLPATLPEIVSFLDQSGEYARLPVGLWQRLEKLKDLAPMHIGDNRSEIKQTKSKKAKERGIKTGLEATVDNRSLGSGVMAELFNGYISVKGGLANREQLEGIFKDHRYHKEIHAMAKLRTGIAARPGQKSIAAEWDPVHFAVAAISRGQAFESQLDNLFMKQPALADWRNAWNELKPNQPRKQTTPS